MYFYPAVWYGMFAWRIKRCKVSIQTQYVGADWPIAHSRQVNDSTLAPAAWRESKLGSNAIEGHVGTFTKNLKSNLY